MFMFYFFIKKVSRCEGKTETLPSSSTLTGLQVTAAAHKDHVYLSFEFLKEKNGRVIMDPRHKECDNKADGRQWRSSRLYKAGGRRRPVPRVLADRNEGGMREEEGKRGHWTLAGLVEVWWLTENMF